MDAVFKKGSVLSLDNMIEYAADGIVSKQVLKNKVGNITLFAFDQGQGLSEHTAPFDAFVQILDGEAEIIIGGNPLRLKKRGVGDYAGQRIACAQRRHAV